MNFKNLKLFPIAFLLCSCGSPDLDNIKKSKNFDGEIFYLEGYKKEKKGFLKVLKWRLNNQERAKWPIKVKNKSFPLPQEKNAIGELSITFINHATCLIQIDGKNIITDPIWSKRASPVSWAGPKRVRKPGVPFQNLPKIDVILISHNHYDHMDLDTINKIINRDNAKVIFGLGSSYYLNEKSAKNSIELDWNQSKNIDGLEYYFLPSRHWSKRTFNDTNKSLWGAFVIKGVSKKVYFAGDTGYSNHFKKASKQFNDFDLALIPIGAFEPRWLMKSSHLNPADAMQAHFDLRSKLSVGIHHRTFQLTDEAINEPNLQLQELIKKKKPTSPFITLAEGETRVIH